MRSVMEHRFSEVPRVDIPRSSFNRSHGLKTTFDADWLVPVLVDEVVPGDTFNVDMHFFARLATPIHPIMDNIRLESFFFFVPYRLLWSNWERFQGAQDDPADSIDYTIPVIASSTTHDGTAGGSFNDLIDYMGLPFVNGIDLSEMSALPMRAYNLIWNEWFRDQNLQDSLTVDVDDGPDATANYELRKRGKRHDYFTSCLPWPQKGDAVEMPLGTSANVLTSSSELVTGVQAPMTYRQEGGTLPGASRDMYLHTDGEVKEATSQNFTGATGGIYPSNLYADLSTAVAPSINDLRLAFQTQRLLERDARSGTRYNEIILSHFGVTVPDFRVQRPEFLGGGSSPVNITPVAQTTYQGTPTVEDAKGNLAGFGTVSGRHGFTKSFVEHGIIIGLVNARADITYQQGVERMWTRSTRYDFYMPVLSQIGEQSVLNKEIYYDVATPSNRELVFGYQERYAEYRYKPSRLSGLMRSARSSSLDPWHLAEEFSSLPTLGDTFIQSNTGVPLDRAIAVTTEPHFIGDFYFSMKCARPMPLYGVPGNLDHF